MRRLNLAKKIFPLLFTLGFWAVVVNAQSPSPSCAGLDQVSYPSCASGDSVAIYRCWERALTSNQVYSNPSTNVTVRVNFFAPGGVSYSVYAFWDGDDSILTPGGNQRRFKFRTFFPLAGTYYWNSYCVSGCSGETGGLVASGTVSVTPPPVQESNRFYSRGYLKGIGLLHHARGGDFFWHGDTAWTALLRACRTEWQAYVDQRAAQKLTVVQLALAQDWAGVQASAPFSGTLSRRGRAPFRQVPVDPGHPNTGIVPNAESQLVSEFWRELEGMIHYANSKGLLVLVAGLNHPVGKFPSIADARRFARNLGARLAGYHVAISPGLDTALTGSTEATIDAIGADLQAQNPWMLLVNHYATPGQSATDNESVSDMSRLHNKTWLAAHLFQSGFNRGNAETIARRARTMPQLLRGYTNLAPFNGTSKQAINAESIYTFGYGYDSGAEVLDRAAFNAYRARQTSWLSWLSGALGHSFGSAGIWEWGMCSMLPSPPNAATCDTFEGSQAPPDPVPQNTSNFGDLRNYSSAMAIPTQRNMSSTLNLAALDFAMQYWTWFNLVQNEQVHIKNNGSLERYKSVLSRDPDLVLAYLPHNACIDLDTRNKNIDRDNAWFYNPRYLPGTNEQLLTAPLSKTHNYTNGRSVYCQPGGLAANHGSDDWVLALFPLTSLTMTWHGNRAADANTLVAWPDLDPTEEGVSDPNDGGMIRARILGPSGDTLLEGVVPVQPASPTLPRRIRAARDGQGRFLVTWEKVAANEGESVGLGFARFDSQLREDISGELAPSSGGKEMLNSSVAADNVGNFVIAWEERNLDEQYSRVVAQRFMSNGLEDGPSFEVASVKSGGQRRPRVACAPSGQCWIAWEHTDAEDAAVTIRAQRFDAFKSATGLDFQLSSLVSNDIWLTNLSVSEFGDVTATWERFGSAGDSLGLYSAAWMPNGISISEETLISPPPPSQ